MRCRLCHRPLEALDQRRGLTLCRRVTCQGRNEAQRIEQERRAMTEAGLAAAQRLDTGSRVREAVWLLPYEATLVPTLPQEREEAGQAWLQEAAAAARELGASASASASASAAAGAGAGAGAAAATDGAAAGAALCSQCQGRCCTAGRDDHAFLHDGALRRWLMRHPGQPPEAAVHAYLQALPDQHVEGSCLFHGARGCALPREDRGDTCNAYGCLPYRSLQEAVTQQPPQAVLVLRAKGGRLTSARVIAPDGSVQSLPPPDEPPA